MKEKEQKTIAIVTINGLGDFSPKGAEDVSNWLKQTAKYVKKDYKLWTKKKAVFKYIAK